MVNWITKYIKPKLKSIFKKRSAENDEALWQNCSCSKLTLKEDFKKNLFVCPSCNKPHPLNNKQRFDLFLDEPQLLPDEWKKKLKQENELEIVIGDYIASMTDKNAINIHEKYFNLYSF